MVPEVLQVQGGAAAPRAGAVELLQLLLLLLLLLFVVDDGGEEAVDEELREDAAVAVRAAQPRQHGGHQLGLPLDGQGGRALGEGGVPSHAQPRRDDLHGARMGRHHQHDRQDW